MVVWCFCYFAKVSHLSCCDECVGIRDVVEYLSDSCVSDVFIYYFRHSNSKVVADTFVPE